MMTCTSLGLQINEAMCGIGVFIEASQNGLLTIKQASIRDIRKNVDSVRSSAF